MYLRAMFEVAHCTYDVATLVLMSHVELACESELLLAVQLRVSFEGLAERWWFAPEHNDSLRQSFKKTEPKKSLQVNYLRSGL